ncbi:MAG: 3-deoxy-7-phosphoheptulonate synthase [Candidatus Korobacteraceae bacterium]|jgi:3-deoxy-7-phosphoheptulonate synthase
MLVSMRNTATREDVLRVVSTLQNRGIQAHVVREASRIVVVTNQSKIDGNDDKSLRLLPAVDSLINVTHRFKLASIQSRKQRTIVRAGDVEIGGETAVVIAGPCSVESREQLMAAARGVRDGGATMLRGGAYKPRTSPYEFQGLGVKGLKLLAEAREETGLPIVTEVMSTDDVEIVCEYADVLQVGARNMQNFALLRRLATVDKPVLLKRNPAASVEEWLLAAEYLLAGGNSNVILCERGIKGSGAETRNTFDIGAVALARQLTHLPVLADPSHATGRRDLVPALSRAALAAGADGLLLEVHPNPENALSDGAQSLNVAEFAKLMRGLAEPVRRVQVRAPAPLRHVSQRREIMHANQ